MKTYITLLAILLLAPCSSAMSQKKKTTKAVNQTQTKEDFSIYTENPVCQVIIADSVVVPINDMVKNIPLPSHIGRLFSSIDNGGLIMFENEFADTRLFAVTDDTHHHNLYRQTLIENKWNEPELLQINGEFLDLINPILMPDGQTLYFAARTAEDNEGKTFSLYTTTLDVETASYLTPQRLPFPFVSDDNDLYYIEDEADSIAWLVTTRRQPTGMACIYTMRNKQPWTFYDSEETPASKLKSLALIQNIQDTWPSASERQKIMDDINNTLSSYNKTSDEGQKGETVVRNELQKKIDETQRQLDEYRKLYNGSSADKRSQIKGTIIETENKLRGYHNSLRKL